MAADQPSAQSSSEPVAFAMSPAGGSYRGIRDSKAAIVREARESVEHQGDVVCDGCGWMGRWL